MKRYWAKKNFRIRKTLSNKNWALQKWPAPNKFKWYTLFQSPNWHNVIDYANSLGIMK